MGDFVPLHPSGGREQRTEGADPVAPQDLDPPPPSYDGMIHDSERPGPDAYTNFNSASVVGERSGDLSRMTWIMTVVAGVVLGAVMTFIAAGS